MKLPYKNWTSLVIVLFLILELTPYGQDLSTDEQRLMSILQSNASLQEKDAACKDLKRIASSGSVPV